MAAPDDTTLNKGPLVDPETSLPLKKIPQALATELDALRNAAIFYREVCQIFDVGMSLSDRIIVIGPRVLYSIARGEKMPRRTIVTSKISEIHVGKSNGLVVLKLPSEFDFSFLPAGPPPTNWQTVCDILAAVTRADGIDVPIKTYSAIKTEDLENYNFVPPTGYRPPVVSIPSIKSIRDRVRKQRFADAAPPTDVRPLALEVAALQRSARLATAEVDAATNRLIALEAEAHDVQLARLGTSNNRLAAERERNILTDEVLHLRRDVEALVVAVASKEQDLEKVDSRAAAAVDDRASRELALRQYTSRRDAANARVQRATMAAGGVEESLVAATLECDKAEAWAAVATHKADCVRRAGVVAATAVGELREIYDDLANQVRGEEIEHSTLMVQADQAEDDARKANDVATATEHSQMAANHESIREAQARTASAAHTLSVLSSQADQRDDSLREAKLAATRTRCELEPLLKQCRRLENELEDLKAKRAALEAAGPAHAAHMADVTDSLTTYAAAESETLRAALAAARHRKEVATVRLRDGARSVAALEADVRAARARMTVDQTRTAEKTAALEGECSALQHECAVHEVAIESLRRDVEALRAMVPLETQRAMSAAGGGDGDAVGGYEDGYGVRGSGALPSPPLALASTLLDLQNASLQTRMERARAAAARARGDGGGDEGGSPFGVRSPADSHTVPPDCPCSPSAATPSAPSRSSPRASVIPQGWLPPTPLASRSSQSPARNTLATPRSASRGLRGGGVPPASPTPRDPFASPSARMAQYYSDISKAARQKHAGGRTGRGAGFSSKAFAV